MADVYALPDTPIRLFLEDAPPGLLGILTIRVRDVANDVDVIAAATAGISETATGDTSTYSIEVAAPAELGDDYLIDWDTGSGHTTATLEVTDTPPASAAANSVIAPSLAEVASYIWGRTRSGRTTGGRLAGTFTADTEPTADMVRDQVMKAVREVRGHVGTPTDPAVVEGARDLAALYAAMLVELRFRGDSARDRSVYDELKGLYDGKVKDVVRQAQEALSGDSDVSEANPAGPSDTFATATGWAEGSERPADTAGGWFTEAF